MKMEEKPVAIASPELILLHLPAFLEKLGYEW